jgi:hypothetical protein
MSFTVHSPETCNLAGFIDFEAGDSIRLDKLVYGTTISPWGRKFRDRPTSPVFSTGLFFVRVQTEALACCKCFKAIPNGLESR